MRLASCVPGFVTTCIVLLGGAVTSAREKGDIAPISAAENIPAGNIAEEWVHVSSTSAVVYWQTENRARSCVEYGATERCERKTPLEEISPLSKHPYWTHFHRLTGLEPGRKYFYRLVCLGSDGSRLQSAVKVFETKSPAAVVRIPDDLAGPPYVLDRKDATYVLTKDLTFPLGGLDIKGDNVTLDMDGHTLVYNDQPAIRSSDWSTRISGENEHGIRVLGRGRATILNGVIRQGKGKSGGTQVGIGCNPVYASDAPVEMAGVEIVWAGPDISGLFFHWAGANRVHHCVMEDQGSHITNRHQAISTIDGNGWGDYDHNLVKLTRQQGLMGGVNLSHNEVYVNSFATNSFAMVPSPKAGRPVEVAYNKVIGIGEHPVGIAMFGVFPPGSTVHDNRVEVKCTRLGEEYGYAGSACFRTTWGADQLDVFKNTFLAHADVYDGKAAKTRAIWVGLPYFQPKGAAAQIKDARGVFHDNLIIARGSDGAPAGGICVVCLNQSPNLIFQDNKVVSTWGNVVLADSYGHADGFAKFVGNVFRREGKGANYYTIRQEYGGIPATGVFLDTRYEDGASQESVKLLEKGEIAIAELLEVVVKDQRGAPIGGARVVIRDKSGTLIFDDVTPSAAAEAALVAGAGPTLDVKKPADKGARAYIAAVPLQKGQLKAALTRYVMTAAGKTAKIPCTVRVTKDGFAEATQTVESGTARRVEVGLRESRK